MRRRWGIAAFLAALCACCHRGGPSRLSAAAEPAPRAGVGPAASPAADGPADGRGEEAATPAPEPPAGPGPGRWELFGGRVADLRERRVLGAPRAPEGAAAVVDGGALYFADGDAVVAAELPSGAERWRASRQSPCRSLDVVAGELVCVGEADVQVFSLRDGDARVLFGPDEGAIRAAVAVADGLVLETEAGAALLVRLPSGDRWPSIPDLGGPRDGTYQAPFVVSTDRSIFCRVVRLAESFAFSCHQATGPQLFASSQPHTDLERAGDVVTHHPVLHLREAGRRHLLFSSVGGSRRRAVVRRIDDGMQVAAVSATVAALVEGPDGAILGLLAVDGEQTGGLALLEPSDGQPRWRVDDPRAGGSATVLLAGDRLVVAAYCAIATGADLLSVDLASGRLLWRADVAQLGASHSRYSNEVALRLRDGEVVMVGREAFGSYVQTFDLATGQRLFSTLPAE